MEHKLWYFLNIASRTVNRVTRIPGTELDSNGNVFSVGTHFKEERLAWQAMKMSFELALKTINDQITKEKAMLNQFQEAADECSHFIAFASDKISATAPKELTNSQLSQ